MSVHEWNKEIFILAGGDNPADIMKGIKRKNLIVRERLPAQDTDNSWLSGWKEIHRLYIEYTIQST